MSPTGKSALCLIVLFCVTQVFVEAWVFLKDEVEIELVKNSFSAEYEGDLKTRKALGKIYRLSERFKENKNEGEKQRIEFLEAEATSDIKEIAADFRSCVQRLREKINGDNLKKVKINNIIEYRRLFKKRLEICVEKIEESLQDVLHGFEKRFKRNLKQFNVEEEPEYSEEDESNEYEYEGSVEENQYDTERKYSKAEYREVENSKQKNIRNTIGKRLRNEKDVKPRSGIFGGNEINKNEHKGSAEENQDDPEIKKSETENPKQKNTKNPKDGSPKSEEDTKYMSTNHKLGGFNQGGSAELNKRDPKGEKNSRPNPRKEKHLKHESKHHENKENNKNKLRNYVDKAEWKPRSDNSFKNKKEPGKYRKNPRELYETEYDTSELNDPDEGNIKNGDRVNVVVKLNLKNENKKIQKTQSKEQPQTENIDVEGVIKDVMKNTELVEKFLYDKVKQMIEKIKTECKNLQYGKPEKLQKMFEWNKYEALANINFRLNQTKHCIKHQNDQMVVLLTPKKSLQEIITIRQEYKENVVQCANKCRKSLQDIQENFSVQNHVIIKRTHSQKAILVMPPQESVLVIPPRQPGMLDPLKNSIVNLMDKKILFLSGVRNLLKPQSSHTLIYKSYRNKNQN